MIEQDFKAVPLTKDFLIKKINTTLKTNWTAEELKKGKDVELEWRWTAVMSETLKLYAENGWSVNKSLMLDGKKRVIILTFYNSKVVDCVITSEQV